MAEANDATLEIDKALKKFLCFLYVANDTPHYIAKRRNDNDYYAQGKHMRSVEILAANESTELVPLDKIKLAMDSGLVRKPNTLIFALAMCARQKKSEKLRASAYYFLGEHCKDWNSIALFVKYASYLCRLEPNEANDAKGRIGWGRGWKNAVNKWYVDQNATDLAIFVGRHKARYGWSHKNILRLSHLDLDSLDVEKRVVVKYVLDGLCATSKEFRNDATACKQLDYLRRVEEFRRSKDPNLVAKRLSEGAGFTIDHVHPSALRSRKVWQCLLPDMDLRTILKYLPKLSQRRFLLRDSPLTEPLVRSLIDPNNLQWNNILPLEILAVLNLYETAPRFGDQSRWIAANVEYDDTPRERMNCITPFYKSAAMVLEAVIAEMEEEEAKKREELRAKKNNEKKRKARKEKKKKKEKQDEAKDEKEKDGKIEKKPKKPAPRQAPNKKIREALLDALNVSRKIDITGSSTRSYVISIRIPSNQKRGYVCLDAGLPIALPLLHRDLAPSDATTIISYSPLYCYGRVVEITKDMDYDEAIHSFLKYRVWESEGNWIRMPYGGAFGWYCGLEKKCDVFIDVQSEPPSKRTFYDIRKLKELVDSPQTRVVNWIVNRGKFELKGDYWQEVLTIQGRDAYVPFIIEAYARGLF